jgi:hypothetical protein
MGKTLPPFSSLIEQERRRWVPFKKALLKTDQALFDRLFDCAKLHIQAGVMAWHEWHPSRVAWTIDRPKSISQKT